MYPTFIEKKNVYELLDSFIKNNDREENEKLLDIFVEKAIIAEDYTFSTGLMGIGWLIAYLSYHDILQIDVDDILYDFDDNIYKITVNKITNRETKIDELINLITYYQQRLQNKSHKHNFYRKFALTECLMLLVNKLKELLEINDRQLSPYDLSKVMLKVSYLAITCINEKDIEDIYYKYMENLIYHYTSNHENLTILDMESLYYLLFSAKQYRNPYWSKSIEGILASITIKNEIRKILEEISLNFDNGRIVLPKILFPKNQETIELPFFLCSNLKVVRIKKD